MQNTAARAKQKVDLSQCFHHIGCDEHLQGECNGAADLEAEAGERGQAFGEIAAVRKQLVDELEGAV